MITLIISRHGKAGELKETQHDLLRELAPRGRKDAKKIAGALITKDIVPGLIISSPAIRSVETARILGETMEIQNPAVVTCDLLYGNFTTELFPFINMLCPEEKVVMIIGHHPSLLLYIEFLSGMVLERFPTLATLVLDFNVNRWSELSQEKGTLRKLLIPKDLV
jgi:phosphohistidine phosphatase